MTPVEQGGHRWTFYNTGAAAPGRRAGWYNEEGKRATATQALYLAELARRRLS